MPVFCVVQGLDSNDVRSLVALNGIVSVWVFHHLASLDLNAGE